MSDDTKEHQRNTDEQPHLHRRRTDVGFRGWIRRNLSVLSYIILALAIAWSINGVRSEGVDRRTEIIVATQRVIKDSCERGNDTRHILRGLILAGNKTLLQYKKDGLITPVQYEKAVAANKAAAAKLPDVDCSAAIRNVSGTSPGETA